MALQCAELDHVGVTSVPLLSEFIAGHGDSMVYFSFILNEVVPGGLIVSRTLVISDGAVYKIPQTASDTGIFFNSRYPLVNFTQILVVDDDSVAQFNGFKITTGEQTLFTLQFPDEKVKRECLLTLCHLLPDLPIIRKKKIEGRYYDLPYVEGYVGGVDLPVSSGSPNAPPLTKGEEKERLEFLEAVQNPEYIEHLLDGPLHEEDDPSHRQLSPKAKKHSVQLQPFDFTQNRSTEAYSGDHYVPDTPFDPTYERQKNMLRAQLFDHDITNLHLRANLSLLEDIEEEYGEKEEHMMTQNALFGKDSDAASAYAHSAGPSLKSGFSRRSEDDAEAQRRRYLLLQEEERLRQAKEKEKKEIEQMLSDLDSRMEVAVAQEEHKQRETQRRIKARQTKSDSRLTALRSEYRQTVQQQKRIEAETREKHAEQRENLFKELAKDAAVQPIVSGDGPQPLSTPHPVATNKNQDRILLGNKVHDLYLMWRAAGGISESEGVWTPTESRDLIQKIEHVLRKMTQTGSSAAHVTRVRHILGNVQRELDMIQGNRDPRNSRVKSVVATTKPKPFNLSSNGRAPYRKLTNQQFRDELNDRELGFNKTRQSLRRAHLENQREHQVDEGKLSPREASRLRGIAAKRRSSAKDHSVSPGRMRY
eukprot:TRINITY_DN12132_c0_g1_i2.p1 TRINITY_DN12132_c0_g1~~TRINITY_DN12132_c0_g1_i2.p1  ORF type:complete len:683 (+),score=112.18 TRINITY_DN12132_c0_g1_i2:109-2049(+)